MAPTVVLGYGATGRSVCAALHQRGHELAVVDDKLSPETQAAAAAAGVDLHGPLDVQGWQVLLRDAEAFCPAPAFPIVMRRSPRLPLRAPRS